MATEPITPTTPPEFVLPDRLLREAVRTERKYRLWTQAQLGERLAEATATWETPLALDPSAIVRLENGTRGISLNEAYALSVLLDLDLGEILGIAGPPEFLKAARDRRVRASRLLEIVESVFESTPEEQTE